ncbi:MAG: hypothetical protein IH856_16280 [Deltaproteobacteria bacterium]|nr:hypothetical protein [Deltaproteobacteria bacterium]
MAYSIRSASEVHTHLYVTLDQGYVSQQFRALYDLVGTVTPDP